ncbi:hypothetical protein, partial [Streptomyces sp. NPDC049879]|uniref:hypothetical protein n=1 Tax=Streptomyces sp. NPDC049879 TaxID=3365598 RepID=UPI0037ADFA1F
VRCAHSGHGSGCAHRTAPGPRVWVWWHHHGHAATGYAHGNWAGDHELRQVQELPNAEAADALAEHLARGLRESGSAALVRVFAVAADGARPPGPDALWVEAGSELWMWTDRPGVEQLRRPDHLWRILPGGGTETRPWHEDWPLRPPLPPREIPPSRFRTVRSRDGQRELTWYDNGDGGLLVSTLDHTSTALPVRVLRTGREEPLGDESAPAGLRVHGHGLHDRPRLAELPRLAPAFTRLAP